MAAGIERKRLRGRKQWEKGLGEITLRIFTFHAGLPVFTIVRHGQRRTTSTVERHDFDQRRHTGQPGAGLGGDMVTAALFGMAAGGVLDALVMAFRVPNLFRAFFGEGALTASYLPVFTESLEQDRHSGQRLYRATAWWLGGVLTTVTVVGEIGIGIWAWLVRDDPQVLLLAGLLAALLPYLIFVCLTAVSSATLQALGQFGPPAFAPAVLNVCWIAGVAVLAPRFADAVTEQAYIVAGCILVGGVLQWLVRWASTQAAMEANWK